MTEPENIPIAQRQAEYFIAAQTEVNTVVRTLMLAAPDGAQFAGVRLNPPAVLYTIPDPTP